jgi:hypothetical protein
MIVSGTGVSMRDVETVLRSSVVKPRVLSPTKTEIGGFNNEVDQRAYLEQYLPPGLLDTDEGKKLVSRIGYWLRGRFVCNTSV